MKNQQAIDQFCDYFCEEIEKVKNLDSPPLYKKILYTSIIDALGQARYPKGTTHKRIVSFIYSYSGWPHRDKVSIIQLSHNLDFVLKEEEKNSKVLKFVQQNISLFQDGKIYRPDIDPPFNDIRKLVTSKKEQVAIKYARYIELFYTYRNIMVHGFRKPGRGIEMSADGSTPYYHSYIDEPWALVFPVDVFRSVCEGSLKGLKEYLLKKDINPYDSYEFGFRWTQSEALKRAIGSKTIIKKFLSCFKKYLSIE